MKTKQIIEGLQILLPYYDDIDGYYNGADHGVIYAYATDDPLSKEDLARIIKLGWHQEHDGVDFDEEFCASEYDADESWYCSV